MNSPLSNVFSRANRPLPVVSHGQGAQVWDTDGRRYLDMCGGAVVVGIGHGVREVSEAVAQQAARVAYAHGTVFTSASLEDYCAELSCLLPMESPAIYPVSGGSEAVETALKMARAYHLARGEDRSVVIGRDWSYHGNTRGALDVSGRVGLRAPYLPWLTNAVHTSTPHPYRDAVTGRTGQWHADQLREVIERVGSKRVAAFIAEPISGATLAASVPQADYWPAVAQVCREYGVLLIADEVMTGFGRTGTWFGLDHWGVRPDILTAGKGAASGYWPLGLTVASGAVHETLTGSGFVHGFTYSHHVVGAAAGLAVLRYLREHNLVEVARVNGAELGRKLHDRLSDAPGVGEIRGTGMLWGVELVANAETREPFPRTDEVTRRVVENCRASGILVYPAAGCADGVSGDAILLGPPLGTPLEQLAEAVEILGTSVAAVVG